MEELYKHFLSSNGVQTDTRKLDVGELFFALSGENFDGNQYIEQALQLGASHVVTNDFKWSNNPKATVVNNVLKTLQNLATHHRTKLALPIVALTGSNGKTTTKELILSVLSQKHKVRGTKGNFNNHIGVPLTLLSFNKETEIGVVEMGANHMKEIELLSNIALPDYGLITNYGKAHLEGFGSEENIKIGKSELYDYLRTNSKTAIVGHWDQEQINRSEGIKRIFTNDKSKLISTEPFITLELNNQVINTQLIGTYNYNNILLAAAVGKIFNVPTEDISKGLSNYVPSNNRSQIIQKGAIKIILDAYNANPSSMKVALDNLSKQPEIKKIAILGDMFELGKYEKKEHQLITDYIKELNIEESHLIGDAFSRVQSNSSFLYKDYESFKNTFKLEKQNPTVILIKGSRGMALERVLELID